VTSASTVDPGPSRPLLEVEDLVQSFRVPGGTVHAVSGVTFQVRRGETLGLVGESGCGKSSVAKALVRLPAPKAGRIRFDGLELTSLSFARLRRVLPRMQIIFQDPISALNPRRRIQDVIAEGLAIQGMDAAGIADRVEQTMRQVGLDPDLVADRRPGEFSGGQCQRIAIARAMALHPDLLICDEPVSALDVSVQAQVLNLLERMRAERGLAMLFISHDLAVVRNISDHIAVMYLGKIVEMGDADDVYLEPAHPYTRALIESVPVPDPAVALGGQTLRGELPSPLDPPSGCRFRTRCPLARPTCAEIEPPLTRIGPGRSVACHYPLVS
jgi:peptide/nickel transport system ATP-binding protein